MNTDETKRKALKKAYRSFYDQAYNYALEHTMQGKKTEDKLAELLDALLEAQRQKQPVSSITGHDRTEYLKSYFGTSVADAGIIGITERLLPLWAGIVIFMIIAAAASDNAVFLCTLALFSGIGASGFDLLCHYLFSRMNFELKEKLDVAFPAVIGVIFFVSMGWDAQAGLKVPACLAAGALLCALCAGIFAMQVKRKQSILMREKTLSIALVPVLVIIMSVFVAVRGYM